MASQEVLFQILRKFARTMAGAYEIADVLTDLSHNAVEMFGATAAGVALCEGGQLRFVTATNDAAVEAEDAQERLQSGPCYTSLQEQHPIPVRDIRDRHADWPEYGPIVERAGLLAVLGLPLILDDRRVGSLDVYADQPREWTDDAIAAGTVLADIAAAFVLNATELAQSQRTSEQLQTALDSRVVIEQAKGRLAGELNVSPREAFEIIRHHARSNHRRIAETSRAVVEHGARAMQA